MAILLIWGRKSCLGRRSFAIDRAAPIPRIRSATTSVTRALVFGVGEPPTLADFRRSSTVEAIRDGGKRSDRPPPGWPTSSISRLSCARLMRP
jgi:hypothetical protein